MEEVPTHPITTPKGAAAITILLGVVSVFAPFLFDLRSALVLGAVAILVIVWTYWSEIQLAWASRSWNVHLNVPLGAMACIVVMGFVSARSTNDAPKPFPAVSADAVAEKVENWMMNHQPQPQPLQVVEGNPDRLEVQPHHARPLQIPHVTVAPPANNAWFADLSRKISEQNARRQAYETCHAVEFPVTLGLVGFIAQAVNYQNGWAYSRDGSLVRDQYVRWVGAVRDFFAAHSDVLHNTEAFERVNELDMEPSLLGIFTSSGENAWRNFDARRKALITIEQNFTSASCKAQSDSYFGGH